jgi:hypothetical protein
MNVHRLTKARARRIAVRAQLLDAPRPTELLEVVQQVEQQGVFSERALWITRSPKRSKPES